MKFGTRGFLRRKLRIRAQHLEIQNVSCNMADQNPKSKKLCRKGFLLDGLIVFYQIFYHTFSNVITCICEDLARFNNHFEKREGN